MKLYSINRDNKPTQPILDHGSVQEFQRIGDVAPIVRSMSASRHLKWLIELDDGTLVNLGNCRKYFPFTKLTK